MCGRFLSQEPRASSCLSVAETGEFDVVDPINFARVERNAREWAFNKPDS
jgi:hypothetical protein